MLSVHTQDLITKFHDTFPEEVLRPPTRYVHDGAGYVSCVIEQEIEICFLNRKWYESVKPVVFVHLFTLHGRSYNVGHYP